jgi:hypothetical protein
MLLVIYFMMAGFSLLFYLLYTLWWHVLTYHSTFYLLYDGRFPASLLLQRRRMGDLRGSPAQSDAANTSKESGEYTEMEYLYVILTKDSSLLHLAIRSPIYCRILQKMVLYSAVLKLHSEKFAEQIKNSSLFMSSVL